MAPKKIEKKVIELKVQLDAAMLRLINTYYAAKLTDQILGRECFSEPCLDSHACNPLALVCKPLTPRDPRASTMAEAAGACPKCGSILGRPCDVTCDIHYFCLAAYAARFGIGRPTKRKRMESAIKHNLTEFNYKTLLDLVLKQVDSFSTKKAPVEIADNSQLDLEVPDPPTVKLEVSLERPVDESGNPLLTLSDAAKVYGLSKVVLFNHVKNGRIAKVSVDGATYVQSATVKSFLKKEAAEKVRAAKALEAAKKSAERKVERQAKSAARKVARKVKRAKDAKKAKAGRDAKKVKETKVVPNG